MDESTTNQNNGQEKQQASDASFFANRKAADKVGVPVTIGDATFYVGRPSLSKLTKTGQIPADIAAKAANVTTKMNKSVSVSGAELEAYQEYERLMVMAGVRTPKIVEGEAVNDGEVSIDDLTDDEVTELSIYIQGGQEGLNSFRTQRLSALAGLNSQKVQPETE